VGEPSPRRRRWTGGLSVTGRTKVRKEADLVRVKVLCPWYLDLRKKVLVSLSWDWLGDPSHN
jgi:hypothetical protein